MFPCTSNPEIVSHNGFEPSAAVAALPRACIYATMHCVYPGTPRGASRSQLQLTSSHAVQVLLSTLLFQLLPDITPLGMILYRSL